ncbi:MAG TPA: hypothetical protein VGY53_05740, partial [Isosphaeraceae bacterium]|nr:hypothetical protein [Isosphaeraceae bacterium]
MKSIVARGQEKQSSCCFMQTAVLLGLALAAALSPGPARGQQMAGARNMPAVADPYPFPPGMEGRSLAGQSVQVAAQKSAGCIQCHQNTHDPHDKPTVRLGCIDCHGGNPSAGDKLQAHVRPRFPEAWATAANPVRSYTLLNHESPEFTRFVNPGDLRIAHLSCGTVACHPNEVLQNRKSMMAHGAMLWGAALYNNGSVPFKAARFGESYSMHGAPQRLQTVPPPTEQEMRVKGVVPFLDPLPRFEMTQPGNILRIFERGGKPAAEVGIPNIFEDNGRPRARLSDRGLGTKNRTDPVFVSLNKSRLFDPTLNFLGTNDHPGDYRSSGCTACHVIYANDRSPVNSGPYHLAGNLGFSWNPDPTIPKNERGHPIDHKFTSAIPTSQCIVCHIHPGTNVLNSYTGFMWWDEETDGELLYPRTQRNPTAEQFTQSMLSNPDETAARGLWSDPRFLERVAELNPQARHTQFADFHGHGWVFRAVYKKDRKGNLLDHADRVLPSVTTADLMAAMEPPTSSERQAGKQRDGIPVHQMDIHLEKGMHCVDCHFATDAHGDGLLHGEYGDAIEIGCEDCHGTIRSLATLRTSGPAAPAAAGQARGTDLSLGITAAGRRRFVWRDGRLFQRSMLDADREWEVVQVRDSITPGNPHYSERSRLAKTLLRDGVGWGGVPADEAALAHSNSRMTCYTCHSSWMTSCSGCHLP